MARIPDDKLRRNSFARSQDCSSGSARNRIHVWKGNLLCRHGKLLICVFRGEGRHSGLNWHFVGVFQIVLSSRTIVIVTICVWVNSCFYWNWNQIKRWLLRVLSLEGKIIITKTFGLSQLIYIAKYIFTVFSYLCFFASTLKRWIFSGKAFAISTG